MTKVKQNTHEDKDKSCNPKNTKTNSWPNRAVRTVSVNCAHWRGSTLATYKTVQIIFPLNAYNTSLDVHITNWHQKLTNNLINTWIIVNLRTPTDYLTANATGLHLQSIAQSIYLKVISHTPYIHIPIIAYIHDAYQNATKIESKIPISAMGDRLQYQLPF